MEVCPLQKTGKELVLDIVNSTNNSSITVDQLVFGEAAAGGEEGNTQLNLAAASDAPWNSFVDVEYTRLDLARVFFGQQVFLSIPENATKEDLFCHLNFSYGLSFAADEFDITPSVEATTRPAQFTIKAKANNLAYTGEVVVYTDNERVHLEERLTISDLKGFTYPNADTPSPNNVVIARDLVHNAAFPFNSWNYPPAAAGVNKGVDRARNGRLEIQMAVIQCIGYNGNYNSAKIVPQRGPTDPYRVVEQNRFVGDAPRGAFEVTLAIGAPEGSPLREGASISLEKLVADYLIRLKFTSRSMNITEKVQELEMVAEDASSKANIRFKVLGGSGQYNGTRRTVANVGTSIAELGAQVQTIAFTPSTELMSGLNRWVGSNSGNYYSRANGFWKVELVATPRAGVIGKPIVLTMEGSATPTNL